MNARCIIQKVDLRRETVGACYIGDDQNYYERWLEVELKPIEKEGQRENMPDTLIYTEDYSEGGGSSDYKKSDEEILTNARARFNIGNIVDVEYYRKGACRVAINLGFMPLAFNNNVVTNITQIKKQE